MLELAQCKLEQYSSVTERMAAQSKILNDLSVRDFPVDDKWRVHYIMDNLPKTAEWTNYAETLELTGQTKDSGTLITHLLMFETKLKRDRGLSPGDALFVTRRQKNGKNRSKESNRSNKPERNSKSDKSNDRPTKCYGCGSKGHKMSECRCWNCWKTGHDFVTHTKHCASTAKPTALASSLFLPCTHQ